MIVDEDALFFDCQGSELLGILAHNPGPAQVGVIVVVGGPQYRVGSHRQFSLLARALANSGYPCLRFDHRGIGDSEGEVRAFDELDEDICAAIDAFQVKKPEISRFVLWGLCDAASAILLYQARSRDSRIAGMVLLNPWVRSEATLATARIRGYYGQRFLDRDFWRKLLQGGINPMQSLGEYLRNLRLMGRQTADPTGFQEIMRVGLESFAQPVQIVLASEDLTAQEFFALCDRDSRWQKACAASNVQCASMSGADHTFSDRASRDTVTQLTIAWLDQSLKKPRGAF